MLNVLKYVRNELRSDIPAQFVELFLTVASFPGITLPELEQAIGMPQGSISRTVSKLGEKYTGEPSTAERQDGATRGQPKKGLGLLYTQPDIHNRRTLAVYVTPKVGNLIRSINNLLQGKPAVA
jgi:DNA-binding MarR family transcriptional regulator